MRLWWPTLLLFSIGSLAQELPATGGVPLRFAGSVSAPLNGKQLLANAAEAWRFSFGLEPGARMELDTTASNIVGTARFNFRSTQLNGREETLGTISYRVRITVLNGECRWSVEELKHTGNRAAPKGGVDIGLLTTGTSPPKRLPGMSHSASVKLWEDAKRQVTDRVDVVRRGFEARLRLVNGQ
ncbi:MAG: hypothetical protein IPG74_09380 [Flavobacteriales bacterium]|nr:hypothetical protein [Flavobacteriales bacterium]MBK7555398.1 hypothetical protein [Flavobacteriales bacterium]MBK9196831.1 hypothetical protein [Flavobacteriales bacterium]